MVKGALVTSTPTLTNGDNGGRNRLGGLLDSLDALSPPRVHVYLEGDAAAIHDRRTAAPLARLQIDPNGTIGVIEGQREIDRLSAQGAVPAALHLDPARVLRRDVRLPRATPQSDLKGAIGFEIERHTPFRAQDVVYGWRIENTPGDSGSITAQVVIAQRHELQNILLGLGTQNLGVVRLFAEIAGEDVPMEVPKDTAAPPPRPRRWLHLMLLAALVAALVSPLYWLHRHADAIALEANDVKRGLIAARTNNSQSGGIAGWDAVIDLRRHGETVDTLNQLSATLPDGTWLTALTIEGANLVIEGVSDNNVPLVQLLEASPGFEAVVYAAPVVRNQGADGERFVFNLERVSR